MLDGLTLDQVVDLMFLSLFVLFLICLFVIIMVLRK